MEESIRTTMSATVRQVCPGNLLVCDHNTDQEVVVHTANACRFSRGDCVCIHFSGAMTMSIPPQITATSICRVNRCC